MGARRYLDQEAALHHGQNRRVGPASEKQTRGHRRFDKK